VSSIAEMLVVCGPGEESGIDLLNAWCLARQHPDRPQTFKPIRTDGAGGAKVFTSQVLACAGNYFPWRELAEAFPSFPWRLPELTVLVIKFEVECLRVIRATRKPMVSSHEAARALLAVQRNGENHKLLAVVDVFVAQRQVEDGL
jgi:hypothetical protein